MLYVDLPTAKQIGDLNQVRADACISIYLKTTPLTQDIGESRINLGNQVKAAIAQLEEAGLEKRRIWPLQEQFEDLLEDDDFWAHQANSLAILATPDQIKTFRLANDLTDLVEVSDRFHLKPLLRAVSFSHSAHVLAVSENAVRLVEVSANLPAQEIRVPGMPKDAASAVGKASINDRSAGRRIHGSEGQKVHLTQYIRKIDAALRPILANSDMPIILASTLPVDALFRSLTSVSLLPQTIETSPDHMSEAELATAARPVLDAYYAGQIKEFHDLYSQRTGQNRTTSDLSAAARAATFGGIESLLVDFDSVTNGLIDEETGVVTFDDAGDAVNYGVVDEIAGRAMRTGAKVLAVRKSDIPDEKELAAILRYPI